MKRLILAIFLAPSLLFSQSEPMSLSGIDGLINSYQFEQALREMQATPDSTSINIIQRRAYCYLRLGAFGDAIRTYRKALSLDSTNQNTLMQLAQLYGKNNQYAEAAAHYEKLISIDSTNSYYFKQYGIAASQANDFVMAISNLRQAVQLNPRDIESQILFGNLLLEIEQYELADSVLQNASFSNRSPQLRLLSAKAKLGLEKYEDVISITESLLEKGDTIPVYARLLGVSYFQLSNYKKVIPFMQFLLNQRMEADWIYYYLGVSYQQVGATDSAIVYLNKAIDKGISENIGNYYTQLASSYEQKKDFKSAIRYYKAAYETSKSDIVLYHLARNFDVYYKDKTQAIAYFKRYLNSDDTIRLAREYSRLRLDELSTLR